MRRIISWLGSDWRLPFTSFALLAVSIAFGLKAQQLMNTLDEDHEARQEGRELTARVASQASQFDQ